MISLRLGSASNRSMGSSAVRSWVGEVVGAIGSATGMRLVLRRALQAISAERPPLGGCSADQLVSLCSWATCSSRLCCDGNRSPQVGHSGPPAFGLASTLGLLKGVWTYSIGP